MSVFGNILVHIFPQSDWITPNTDIFHAVVDYSYLKRNVDPKNLRVNPAKHNFYWWEKKAHKILCLKNETKQPKQPPNYHKLFFQLNVFSFRWQVIWRGWYMRLSKKVRLLYSLMPLQSLFFQFFIFTYNFQRRI